MHSSARRGSMAPPPAFATSDVSLFIDFDGTLVEMAEQPNGVVVDDSVLRLLSRLEARLAGRMALVSGRSIAQLDALIGPALMDLTCAGSHGAEIRRVGSIGWQVDRPEALIRAEAMFRDTLSHLEGVVIEVKSLGVAIHYRQNPSHAAQAEELAMQVGLANGLEVQEGKMMVEVRVGGHDKGSAIAALMRTAPFAGHMPLFAGDDVTDEAGFRCCADLGGAGILVGPERQTAAKYRLTDVTAVNRWLAAF